MSFSITFARRGVAASLLLLAASVALGNSYAGRLRSIANPRFTGIKALVDQDGNPAVPNDGTSSSNFWIGLNANDAAGVTNWVQIGWSRESIANGMPLLQRAYVEWTDPNHHLAFFAIPAGLLAEYRVELTGTDWTWTAGGTVLDTKADGDWAKMFCTAQAQAEMIPDDGNVAAPGETIDPSCIRDIETRINAGAYADDDLSATTTSGMTTNNVKTGPRLFSNGFCVWDLRN